MSARRCISCHELIVGDHVPDGMLMRHPACARARDVEVPLWGADSPTTSTTVVEAGPGRGVYALRQTAVLGAGGRYPQTVRESVVLTVDELRTLLPVLAAAVEQYDREARA